MTPGVAALQQLSDMTSPEPIEPINSEPSGRRPRRLPATGMPVRGEDRRASGAVSTLLHILVILMIIGPVAAHTGVVVELPQGAGGAGPAGGGGGGRRGTGGVTEHVQYIKVAAAATPVPQAVVPPPTPTPTPKPQPVVVPPPEVKAPEPTPPPTKQEIKGETKVAEATAPNPGSGGGSGNDGTAGNGPGTGGGVGSGVGTGRGSGVGPGTGGGSQVNYPPTAIELFIPPLPFPGKLRGFHLIAEFDVDETGKVLDWKFNSTGDGGYDRKLNDVLKSTRFRPGTSPDGKPIRMKAQIIYDF